MAGEYDGLQQDPARCIFQSAANHYFTDHQSGEILVAAYSASNYHGNIYTLIYAARGNKTGQYELALFTQGPGMAWILVFCIRRTL